MARLPRIGGCCPQGGGTRLAHNAAFGSRIFLLHAAATRRSMPPRINWLRPTRDHATRSAASSAVLQVPNRFEPAFATKALSVRADTQEASHIPLRGSEPKARRMLRFRHFVVLVRKKEAISCLLSLRISTAAFASARIGCGCSLWRIKMAKVLPGVVRREA